MMRGLAFAFLGALAGCSDVELGGAIDVLPRELRLFARITDSEIREQRDAREVAQMTFEADWLLAAARLAAQEATAATESFARAERDFEHASRHFDRAAGTWRAAEASYASAAQRFRLASIVAVVVAGHALASPRGGLCQTVSTSTYRRRLAREGVDLSGLDVDHLWPRSRGGADHPWNYQLLESSVNRSLGANLMARFHAMPLETLKGLAATAIVRLACVSA